MSSAISFIELRELRKDSIKELNEHLVAIRSICDDFSGIESECPLYDEKKGHCSLDSCPNAWKEIE